jgi:hypothetical protein
MKSRLGLKLLGLSALVVGLMAFGATAAQAEESGGTWTFINAAKELKELPSPEALSGNFETGTDGTLLTTILKKSVEFLCTAFSATGNLLKGGTALGTLDFTGCSTKIGGVNNPACVPNAGGTHPELIITLPLLATLLLHKLTTDGVKDKIIIVEPDTGSNAFAHIEMSELCPIGTDVLVGGRFAIIPSNPTTHEVKHLIKEFVPLTHLWTISDTAEHAAHIDGSAEVFLSGANVGKSWAALWN